MRAALLPSRNAAHKIILNPFFFQLILSCSHMLPFQQVTVFTPEKVPALRKSQYFLDIISGSVFDLNINLTDILSYETDSQKLQTSQEPDGQNK